MKQVKNSSFKCPHCAVVVRPEIEWVKLGDDIDGRWNLEKYECPNCDRWILYLDKSKKSPRSEGSSHPLSAPVYSIKDRILVHPKGAYRPIPPEVPKEFAQDFKEACLVLNDSPKASAALSRRCLQNILREKAEVKHGHLYDEIQEVIDNKTLQSQLSDALHMVRVVGNFAAHPIKSESTGEILPVEPQEAEWNLDVLEALFDYYFVQSEKLKKKKAALNKKLKDAGKKGIK